MDALTLPQLMVVAAVQGAAGVLLRGELPPGGKCDLKTLALESGVTRTGFYPKKNRDGTTRPGPYQHLAEEFERRLVALQQAGQTVDPRIAQIQRLKAQVAELKEHLANRDEVVAELPRSKVSRSPGSPPSTTISSAFENKPRQLTTSAIFRPAG
ncbi:hypothetical protein [Streptomyces sp. NPDC001530]|uniref:hypothetical protein n=1 Tax=Streptomyces sp. NPDC001530 TaxID=3364582 RepID=UPI0036CCDC2D